MTTKIKGTVLVPGVSRNNRFYSAPMIAAAVERAQPRVQAGRMIMRSHHDSGDDPTHVIGRVTSLKVGESGEAKFEAELADTPNGRTVATLVKGPRPFVDAVSLTGSWLGKPRQVKVGGQAAESAEGLDIQTVDITLSPGVEAARFTAELAESFQGTRVIFEQAPGPVVPADPEPTPREFSAMTSEEFDQAAGQLWAGTFAAMDERRAETPSPFWRGLTRTT